AQTLQENERIRAYLARILEGLPCGVVVIDAAGHVRVNNPAALRLLEGAAPQVLLGVNMEPVTEKIFSPQNSPASPTLAVSKAVLPAPSNHSADSIFILRDMRHEKQLQQEREAAR